MSTHSDVLPTWQATVGAQRTKPYLASAHPVTRDFYNSAHDTSFVNETFVTNRLPFNLSTALITLARRRGLSAAAHAYDAGLVAGAGA